MRKLLPSRNACTEAPQPASHFLLLCFDPPREQLGLSSTAFSAIGVVVVVLLLLVAVLDELMEA